VITGIGVVGPYGCGREELAQALRTGRARTSEVVEHPPFHPPDTARRALRVGNADLSAWLSPGEARRMSVPSRWAVAAARMAVEDAGLADEAVAGRGTSVVLATSFGPTAFTEQLVRAVLSDPATASPFHFTECVANAPAGEVALLLGLRGANITITQREPGPLTALVRAAQQVREGRAEKALAGAVEEMVPLLHAVLQRFGALAGSGGGDPEVARPFGLARDGFLAAEGAAVVLLEPEEAARRRGARMLARVVGGGGGFDPTAPPTDWGRGGDRLGVALARFLESSETDSRALACIVSGASGSRRGDALEAGMLRRAWGGSPLPAVLAPKGVTGEYGGGFLAAAVLVASGRPVARPEGSLDTDPRLAVEPSAWEADPATGRMLVTSTAAGGSAAWALLEAAG
jgi:3-oxoacyl-[acyl-carrier-protein] synthase II